jgi:hypothetical protein
MAQLSESLATSALGAAGISNDSATPNTDKMGALPGALNPGLQPLLARIKIILPLPPIR